MQLLLYSWLWCYQRVSVTKIRGMPSDAYSTCMLKLVRSSASSSAHKATVKSVFHKAEFSARSGIFLCLVISRVELTRKKTKKNSASRANSAYWKTGLMKSDLKDGK